jgi:hypothetical protein
MRTNSRPSARHGQDPGDRLADRGLARAGRAHQREDRARALVRLDPALLAQLAHGDVLDDAVLDVLQAGVVLVEHRPRVPRVEPLLRAPAPRHGEEPVEVVADRRGLGPRELALGLLAHGLRGFGLVEPAPVLVHDRAVVLAELLANRLELAAEDVLALLLRRALFHVLADPPPHLHLGEALALEARRQLEPLADVERLQQAHLLLEREVGRVPGGVGQRAGLRDRADERRDAAVVAPQLEDLLDDRAVLGLQLAQARVGLLRVGALLDLDAEAAEAVGLGRAGDAAVQALERDGASPAGQAHAVGHAGDGADGGVVVVVARDEQHALLAAHVHGQGHVHVREDDEVLQGDEQHRAQRLTPSKA